MKTISSVPASGHSAAAAPIVILTCLSMLAFAGNSLLCRLALKQTAIDAVSFTTVRMVSGAVMLWMIVYLRRRFFARQTPGVSPQAMPLIAGSWRSAFALYGYAAAFSVAYTTLPTGTGALLLFGTVQATMIGYGLHKGERFNRWQLGGLACACAGLIWLALPGIATPSVTGALVMGVSGISWAIYSLRGRGAGDPIAVNAGNFIRAAGLAIACSAVMSMANPQAATVDRTGLAYGILSGAVASAIGYVIWYSALRGLKATTAAVLQSSVPVIAALGGVVLLGESPTLRLVIASVAILGGVSVVLLRKTPSR